jgi:hypothetical protein
LGKKDESRGKQALARWEMICRPKKCRGLHIIDFGKQNDALLIKQLHKFYDKADVGHFGGGIFWWRDIMKLVDMHREVCSVPWALVIWLFHGQISGMTNVYSINTLGSSPLLWIKRFQCRMLFKQRTSPNCSTCLSMHRLMMSSLKFRI